MAITFISLFGDQLMYKVNWAPIIHPHSLTENKKMINVILRGNGRYPEPPTRHKIQVAADLSAKKFYEKASEVLGGERIEGGGEERGRKMEE
jgi:hypothetical protein